jgi:hypothetical protein
LIAFHAYTCSNKKTRDKRSPKAIEMVLYKKNNNELLGRLKRGVCICGKETVNTPKNCITVTTKAKGWQASLLASMPGFLFFLSFFLPVTPQPQE